MLLVKSERLSSVHGFGLFSTGRIAAKSLIWRRMEGLDLAIAPEEVSEFPGSFSDIIYHYCFVRER